MALSTLADDTVLQDTVITFGEDFYCVSVDVQFALEGFTAGEGPIFVGWSHGDLSAIEVEEALDANVSDPDDIIANEHSRRPVRKTGVFMGLNTNEALWDGKPIRTTLKFSVGDGHNLNIWAYNKSGATLTTGAQVRMLGTLYGRWQR